MKAIWNGATVAEAQNEDLVRIEGNWYFPPESVNHAFFRNSSHVTECPWKGTASYYDIVVDGHTNDFGAWYYHEPKPGAIERVGKDFTDYVAFWNGVIFSE